MNYMPGVCVIGVIKDYASVVGDQQYVVTASTGNTAPFFGGHAGHGAICGFCYAIWLTHPGYSNWNSAGVLLLKTP
jgi:hypothetical protein